VSLTKEVVILLKEDNCGENIREKEKEKKINKLDELLLWFTVPMVGMVVITSPSFNLYRMVVFPAASRPTISILISRLANSIFTSFDNAKPIGLLAMLCYDGDQW